MPLKNWKFICLHSLEQTKRNYIFGAEQELKTVLMARFGMNFLMTFASTSKPPFILN